MAIQQLVIYLIVYLIPGVALFGIACMIIMRNHTNTTNRLITLLIFLYSFIFFEEFIRHLLPTSYSLPMLFLVAGIVGSLIISATFHFFIHIAKLNERSKIPFYPVICYTPLMMTVIALIYKANSLNNIEIIQKGVWYIPTLNPLFYTIATVFNLLMFILIAILLNGIKHTTSISRKKVLRLFAAGTFFALLITILFGYTPFGWSLLPYPYFIIGITFLVLLMASSLKFNLLPSVSEKYRTMFNIIPVSITVMNSGWEIIELNDYARKELIFFGQTSFNLLDFVRSNTNKKTLSSLIDQLQQNDTLQDYSLSFETKNPDEILHYMVEASRILLEDEELFYIIWRNVTAKMESDRLIQHLAYRDVLTDLHNRAYFVSTVKNRILEFSATPTKEAALILIDLNRFKLINDTYGHAVGDQVLQHTAAILKQSVRKNDLVARLGGDEFVIFLENFSAQQTVFDWNNRLVEAFQQNPFEIGSTQLQIEPSIGTTFFPTDADNFDDLFQLADWNMYEDKLKSREKNEI